MLSKIFMLFKWITRGPIFLFVCLETKGTFTNQIHFRKTWDCDTCVADVQALMASGQSPEAGQYIVATLQGPAFCAADDLNLSPEQVDTCQVYVSRADLAFGLVFQAVSDLALDVCAELYAVC